MKLIFTICLIFTLSLNSSFINAQNRILNIIEQIEKNKNKNENGNENENMNKVEENILNLGNGKTVNLNNWQLVIFIQSTCPHCLKFDPIIKEVSDELKLKTFVFSFDSLGDSSFPNVYPINNDIIATFYRDLPVATPTVFLVNVNSLVTAPVNQGEMDKILFKNQIIKTFILLDGQNEN